MRHEQESTQVGTENKYGYNGKELNDDFGLNLSDYGARWYDASIGRWHSVDPLAEKYASFSPYHFAGNNPIKNFEVDGRYFTEGSQKYITKILGYMTNRINKFDKRIAKLKEKGKLGKAGKIESKRDSYNEEYGNVKEEIRILGESTQKYNISFSRDLSDEADSRDPLGKSTTRSGVYFKDGAVEIILGNSNENNIAHELKHAYQFEIGEFSSGPELPGNRYNSLFYDLHDEVEASKRENFFGGELKSYEDFAKESDYSAVGRNGPISVLNHPELGVYFKQNASAKVISERLQSLSDRSKHVFRFNGVTYTPSKK